MKKIINQTDLVKESEKNRRSKFLTPNKNIRVVREEQFRLWYETHFYFWRKKHNTPAWILNWRMRI